MLTGKGLCIIPARGGSKRIPRKNLKEFLGAPIISYSIKTALKSGLFEQVMVSTDDREIAEYAEKLGAKVPFYRSDKNSDDFATTVDVLTEVISNFELNDTAFQWACCIYPTAPLISSKRLIEAHEKFISGNFDSVIAIQKFSFPVQRAFYFRDSKVTWVNGEYENQRSQDLESIYHDSGQFYFFEVENFKKNKTLVASNTSAVVLSELESQDIDNESDWKIAEMKYKMLF